MEYNQIEKQTLDLLERTNFKNISKSEIISFASKLGEMRPEVVKEILSQFPELANLMRSIMIEHKEMLEVVVKSNDDSIKNYYDINKKGMEGAANSREYYKQLAEKVLDDCGKLIESQNLSTEDAIKIINQEKEILENIQKHEQYIFEQEKYYEEKANIKDTENKESNLKLLRTIGYSVIGIAAITCAALVGADVKFKLPNKQ